MIIAQNNNNLFSAISYDSNIFRDLQGFLQDLGLYLDRIEPKSFLNSEPDRSINYINLIAKDINQRQAISHCLDSNRLCRFSFVHPKAISMNGNIGPGSFIYPLVSLYPRSTVGADNIVHSQCLIAHAAFTGQGCYLSGGVLVGGSTMIGDYCYFGLGCTVYDHVNIVSNCQFGSRTIIRKNVDISARYGLAKNNRLLPLRNLC